MHVKVRKRIFLEKFEKKTLSPFAAHSFDWKDSRVHSEKYPVYRTVFQRDRDRIIHSRAFRRLKHKRQIFITHLGDHYRTRLTHTLEVAQLSRTMARALGLNEDLSEAIALGHDLGHTPFGHVGEIVLNGILKGTAPEFKNFGDLGGFKHNYQGLRVVDVLEKRYSWNGLNLTSAVREGILKHTRLKRGSISYQNFHEHDLYYDLDHAVTLEGQIVAVCDEIAQRTHDLEDGFRAQYVDFAKVRELDIIKRVEKQARIKFSQKGEGYLYQNYLIRSLIDFLITDVIKASAERIENFINTKKRMHLFDELIMWFSKPVDPLQQKLDEFIRDHVISAAKKARSDDLARHVICSLFRLYYDNPKLIPVYRIRQCLGAIDEKELEKPLVIEKLKNNPKFPRTITDHIAGMTDIFAENELKKYERNIVL